MKCQQCGTIDPSDDGGRAEINGVVLDLCWGCTEQLEAQMTHAKCDDCRVWYPFRFLIECDYCRARMCCDCERRHDKKECASLWRERNQP